MKIKSRLTMKKIDHAFVDIVSGRDVYYYSDCYNTIYLAEYPYIPFVSIRVKSELNDD